MRQKKIKNIRNVNKTINKINLICIYRIYTQQLQEIDSYHVHMEFLTKKFIHALGHMYINKFLMLEII